MIRCRYHVLAAVALTALLWSCGGSDGKKADTAADSIENRAEDILQQPQVLDENSIEDLAAKITSNQEFNLDQLAQMITQCEATSNRISQEAERLVQVDDPADTYETLTDLAHAPWMESYRTVIAFLTTASLPDEYGQRVEQLLATNRRANEVITGLERKYLKGQEVLNI